MDVSISLDRFEGADKQIAVLVSDDGQTASVPRSFLPGDARPGDVLRLSLTRDPEATEAIARQTRAVQDQLRKTDPGGDLSL